MEQQKEYYAFISYKREDEKWAKWLQDKLEHYKFPTKLNGRTDLPKAIRPTFRDVTDSTPGLLAEEINNALNNSEWLIVVCSPRSAKSPWVCKEAQTFIDLGRADHIIPFVIEGNPFSNDTATECFPEALLNLTGSKELLAASINEMGRDAAVIKVVARMFNLRFDALWQRYEREQRRKRWMWIGVSFFIALLGLSIGGYFVRQNGIIESQNERLQNDSVIMANHIQRIQNDSITLSVQNDSILSQNALILSQRDSLELSARRLQLSNKLLAEERDNVLRTNWMLMANQSKAAAGKANELIDNGNPLLAECMMMNYLPDSALKYLWPYVPEVEQAYRKSLAKINSAEWHQDAYLEHKLKINTAIFNLKGNKILSASNDNTACLWDIETGDTLTFKLDMLVNCAAISENGKYVATGCRDKIATMAFISQAFKS